MECSLVSDKLYEFIYGELDERTSSEIEKHIENCTNCRHEYMELKKLLVDDMKYLVNLKESIKTPEGLPLKIRSSMRPGFRFNFVKYAAAACLLLALTFTTPVLAYYIIQSTPLEKYIELDSGIIVDFEEGQGQLVQKSSTMNNITMTVDGIIPKKDRTTILFTIKVPKDTAVNYGMPLSGLNVITVTDQFGITYRMTGGAATVKSVNEDGEAKCIYDVDPLGFWAYKLNIRMTAIELGYFDGNEFSSTSKNSYGNWNISFYLKK